MTNGTFFAIYRIVIFTLEHSGSVLAQSNVHGLNFSLVISPAFEGNAGDFFINFIIFKPTNKFSQR